MTCEEQRRSPRRRDEGGRRASRMSTASTPAAASRRRGIARMATAGGASALLRLPDGTVRDRPVKAEMELGAFQALASEPAADNRLPIYDGSGKGYRSRRCYVWSRPCRRSVASRIGATRCRCTAHIPHGRSLAAPGQRPLDATSAWLFSALVTRWQRTTSRAGQRLCRFRSP